MRSMRDFGRDERGNFGAAMAVMIVPLSLVIGVGVDLGSAFSRQAKLQAAADAAALVAVEKYKGNTAGQPGVKLDSVAISIERLAAVDDREAPDREFKVSVAWPAPGVRDVTVRVAESMPTTFMSLAGVGAITLQATATARKTEPKHCLYALDPVSKGAFSVSGAGKVSVPNCGIQVNSASAGALQQSGSGKLDARTISLVGHYEGRGFENNPATNQSLIGDPLEGVPEPVMPATCDYKNRKLSNMTIPAGRVFCEHVTFDGSVTFSPGLHYFKSAVVSVGGQAVLTGSGVTLAFDNSSSMIQASGTGSIGISAPTSGVYAGIAIFGSRIETTSTPVLSFASDGQYQVNGTIYAPRHQVRIKGSSSVSANQSNWIVAWQIAYSGDSDIVFDGYEAPVPKGLNKAKVALVR